MYSGIHNFSEIGKLNKVLLHRPGEELESLTPATLERLLFDDIPYLKVGAYNMGVTLIPGHVFYPCKNGGRDHIRINYSYEPRERLECGMEVLRKALEEELEE